MEEGAWGHPYGVLLNYRNLTLPLFTKDVFVTNCYFSPMRSISILMKHEISFSYFKLFFRTKVSQNAFSFNQIES